MKPLRTWRWTTWGAWAAGALLVAAAFVRLWLLEGWLRTIRIDGPSMAPALCGAHLEVTCSDCGIRFRCDAERLPQDGRLVCPNCGFRELAADDFPLRPGDTVLVDRWPLLVGVPQRWDIVAFDDPLSGEPAVKRVAGLPGERLAIRGGDLYADGQIVRKSLADLRRVAVLVHDSHFQPRSLAAAKGENLRWKPSGASSGWRSVAGGFRHEGKQASGQADDDWLEYVHWRCDASLTPRTQPADILDNDPYNQGLSRRLNQVRDLLVSCEVEFPPGGRLTLAMNSAGSQLEMIIDLAKGAITALQDGREAGRCATPRDLTSGGNLVEFALCDARILVGIEGGQVLACPLVSPPVEEAVQGTSDLKLKCGGGPLQITRLRIWRDVYLLEPSGTDRPWQTDAPLAPGQYLLLGDNPPVSIDSRHAVGGIAADKMRGVLVAPQGSPRP